MCKSRTFLELPACSPATKGSSAQDLLLSDTSASETHTKQLGAEILLLQGSGFLGDAKKKACAPALDSFLHGKIGVFGARNDT